MSQSGLTKLVPKLRYNLRDRRRLRNPEGPLGRHDKIRKIVTALFKHERLEVTYTTGDESRGYAERLIADAIKYGDCHKETMEMASYWLIEKQLVHKLFKVLAPRYQNCPLSYTKMWRAPNVYPGYGSPKCVLELRGNIYPPLGPDKSNHKNLIHNVLLREAKKAYEKEKALKLSNAAEGDEINKTDSSLKEKTSATDMASSESLQASEVELQLNEKLSEGEKSNEQLDSESVKMSEVPDDLSKKDNVAVEKDLNLDKMSITEAEEKESPVKEKDK